MFVPPPPPINRHIGMPDVPTQGHAAVATDDATAVVVHGHHSPPVVVAPAVTGHGNERRRKRKHKFDDDDAAGSGVVVVAAALPSGIDAAADGRATDRARHRQTRTPASERTRTETCSFSAPLVLVSSRRKHRAAAGTYSTAGGRDSYYASDNHFAASPQPHSKPTKPHVPHYSAASASAATADGVPARASTGGKHRHHHSANYADDSAAASISSSRHVIREPAVVPPPPPPPPRHRPAKPHKDNSTPSSSYAPAPPPQQPSEDELLRVGLEVASKMDTDTLHSMVKEYVVSRNHNHQEAEAVEEERLPFWRPLTDDEVDADLRAVYDKVAARKAAACGKRRRH